MYYIAVNHTKLFVTERQLIQSSTQHARPEHEVHGETNIYRNAGPITYHCSIATGGGGGVHMPA